jgi:hypothetical protein
VLWAAMTHVPPFGPRSLADAVTTRISSSLGAAMKRFSVVHKGDVIGTSDLEGRDPGMGVANGRFVPTPAYESVRDVFETFAEAIDPVNADVLQHYFAQRDSLGLELRCDGAVVPTRTIHIADFSRDAGDDAYELEVTMRNAEEYERFFSTR